MRDHLRDALLAGASGAVFLAALAIADATETLRQPSAAAAGIAAALVVEAAFVADTPADRWWERPAVRGASVVSLAAGAGAAALVAGPWALAAVCWGLATYFALLALVLVGAWDGEGQRVD